jgi:hypothetical protein
MSPINSGNKPDGKATRRGAFRAEWLRQFHFLTSDRQEKINKDPMCHEADLLFDSASRECERRREAEE